MVCRGYACDRCTQNCRKLHQKDDSSPTIPGCLQSTLGTDFSKFLYLPPALAKKLKHLDGRNTHIKDSLGDLWPVILACVDKKLAFREGWHRFYQDHGLHSGHTLEIQYVKGSHFVVRIFNTCGFEKIKFNKGRPQKTKRSEGNRQKFSKDEFFKKPMADSFMINRESGKTPMDDSFMINRDGGKTPMDDSFMIDRDGGCHQEEDRNFLDLEKFERVKETAVAKSVQAVDAEMAPAAENAYYTSEQAEITGQDSQMAVVSEKEMNRDPGGCVADEMAVVPSYADINEECKRAMIDTNQVNGEDGWILTGEFGNALEMNVDPTHADIDDQSKIKGDDSKMGEVDTNQMNNGSSGEIFPDEVVKVLEKNMVRSHADINEQLKIKADDSQMDKVDTNQMNNGSSGEIFPDEVVKVLEKNIVFSHADINEQLKIMGDDSQMDEVDRNQINGSSGEMLTDEFVKALETNVIPSYAEIEEQSKIKGNDFKIAKLATYEINGNSGGICTDKFEESCEMNNIGSTEQNETMVDDAQMVVNEIAALHHDTSTDDFHFEPSAIPNSTKGINDAVSKLQNDGESPWIGSNKISSWQSAVKCNFSESSFSSSMLKDGTRCIKRERVELGEEVRAAIGLSGAGTELPMAKKRATLPPVVKVEPDLSSDDFHVSFSAEVKTLSYMEFPVRIPSDRGRDKDQAKVVYLRDSMGRLWPVLYPNKCSVKAFTTNWTNFCKQNNVEPGDECRFCPEPKITRTYRVDVTHRSAAASDFLYSCAGSAKSCKVEDF